MNKKNARRAEFIEEHGNLGLACLKSADECLETAEILLKEFFGDFDDLEEFAWAAIRECDSNLTQKQIKSMDMNEYAKDMLNSKFYKVESNGKMYVFYDYK